MPAPKDRITEVDEIIDPHTVEVDDYDPGGDDERRARLHAEPGEELTTTQNFQSQAGRHHQLHTHETVDAIVDLGVQTLDPEAETYDVRVHVDIGPVFYGGTEFPIELKKNHRYRVPAHVYRYLFDRGLLVDQLGEYTG